MAPTRRQPGGVCAVASSTAGTAPARVSGPGGFFTHRCRNTQDYRDALKWGRDSARALTNACGDEVETFWPPDSPSATRNSLDVVIRICDRFPISARRLRVRYGSRVPLVMDDEHDVQYLLGSLLDMEFDDIEPESWAPSYAGGASRIDFVLRAERIAIETKMTRDTLSSREVGAQLIVDRTRYEAHTGVDSLVCLVYDPDHRLSNPRGLEDDLERNPGRLDARVLIVQCMAYSVWLSLSWISHREVVMQSCLEALDDIGRTEFSAGRARRAYPLPGCPPCSGARPRCRRTRRRDRWLS